MYIYSFEKLEVWNDAKQLAVNIYQLTEAFPSSEKFGMTSQLRRASVSIASNIAKVRLEKRQKIGLISIPSLSVLRLKF